MNVKWKAVVAGSAVFGAGLGGFGAIAAADEVDRLEPGNQTLQQASAGSPLRLKFKGSSWYQDQAGSDGVMSANSPFSSDSPTSPDSPDSAASPASANSPDSPAAPPNPSPGSGSGSGGGGGSGSGGGGGSDS
jgi:hypothetical protein